MVGEYLTVICSIKNELIKYSYLVKECVKHTYLTRGTILLAYTDILNGLQCMAVGYSPLHYLLLMTCIKSVKLAYRS